MQLSNKVALITGATGGIGEATARRFAAEGAKLALIDLAEDAIDALVADLGSDTALGIAADVTDDSAMASAVATASSHFGKLDIAFLNAGIEGDIEPLESYSLETYERVMAVNARGVFLGLKHVFPPLKQNGGGSVIITSSLAGLRGMPRISAYVASKHAAVGLMKSAALEGASAGIRVNTINPAPIATRMIEALEQGFAPGSEKIMKEKMERAVPLKRYGQPHEVASLALFLASDEASYITGNSYPVDGGMSAS